jgi:sec-independent protein translocase protein TatA
MFNLPLFLNDIGGSEILLIMMVVLMFFGSKSIPGIAKTLGRTLYEFRNATSELQNEIKKSGFDIKNDLKIENILKENAEPILQPMDQVFSDIENTVHYGATTQHLTLRAENQEEITTTAEKDPEVGTSQKAIENTNETSPSETTDLKVEEQSTIKTKEQ